jgi:defect-in-organelle-trafficking protein DotC
MFKPRGILLTATVLSSLLLSRPGWADGSVRADPVPPMPTVAEVDQAARTLGNPINQPVTGAAEAPNIVGGVPPPSLEALQAARPGDQHSDGLKPVLYVQ